MASIGWVRLHRSIMDNWIWFNETFSRGQAWLDLILLANHKDNKTMHNGNLVTVKRGAKITSVRQLSLRWKWSTTKVKKFLDTLQADNMIDYKSDGKKTVYTIVNYELYQGFDEEESNTEITQKNNRSKTEKKQKNNRSKTEKKQKKTNNNDNNINNDNKDSQQNKFADDSLEIKLSKYLFTRIRLSDEKAKVPNFQTWAKSIDYLIRLDKREPQEIEQVIDFATSDNFWKANILSTYKLREKYQTLLLQTKGNNSTGYSKKKGYQEEVDDEERERRKAFIEDKMKKRRKQLRESE